MSLINREDLIAEYDRVHVGSPGGARKLMVDAPTIEERKAGRWIDCTSSDHWKCSECGDRAPMYWDANRQEYDEWHSPYCPNCGADMRGERGGLK